MKKDIDRLSEENANVKLINKKINQENKDLTNGDLGFAKGSELFSISAGLKQNPFDKFKNILQ